MLMSSPSQPPGRMSQVLPSISCSQCRAQIPLEELGDHICKPAPPLPTLNLPKPVLSPGAAASLLPQRLQGRVVQPPVSPRSPQPPPAHSPRSSSSTFRGGESLRLNTSGPPRRTASPSRSSPLSRTGDGPPPPRDPYASRGESPVRNRPPIAPFSRARSGSNASSTMSSPTTARPSFSSTRDVPPPSAIRPPPPAETGLNTQIGGEAGMAGVGRRGFAAAARAAMFATSVPAPPPSQQTRANPPRNLDIGAATGSAWPSSVFGNILIEAFVSRHINPAALVDLHWIL
ncbi:hypothetical protein B0H11DRAFT_1170912 [Mycena galericulata]|nr:hypothetical protein B0H11DRAFT_1170912 [Mycena galericulata]